MVDATILTRFGVPNNTGVIRAFQNTLLNKANIDAQEQAVAERRANAPLRNQLLEAQVGQAQQQEAQQREESRMKSIVTAAAELAPTIRGGDVNAVRTQLLQRKTKLIEQGLPTNDTDEAIALLSQPDGLAQLQAATQQAITLGQQLGVLESPAGGQTASARDFDTFKQLQARAQQTGDPSDIESARQFGEQAGFDRVTPQEQADIDVDEARRTAQARSDIDVGAAGRKKAAELREVRISGIKEDMSTRNRNAAREFVRINKALTLVATADQGIKGAAKLQIARMFPSIDVSDEAALDQALTQGALAQLQAFSGPTTDFEFTVAEGIGGRISDPASANRARLKSLQRNAWFQQREFKQFTQHAKSGGDPDAFAFNFGEPMKTKKGVFTLQQIQDTAVANNLSIDETLARLNK